jgi:tRNA modification GTPase
VYNTKDNIVALATTPGKSALNVVRCSGSGCLELYYHLTKLKKPPTPNMSCLKSVYNKDSIIDELMLTFFAAPKSFTGENVLELSSHGGLIIAKKLISTIESFGFRQAMPGEFSYRAFLNGKIDLIQAEAISTIVDSNKNLDVLYSINNLKGSLSSPIKKILQECENVLAYMEHEMDFNENEIAFTRLSEYKKNFNKLEKKASKIIYASFLAKENKGNITISLAGKTNAGKSSLFNKLIGYERSIVTEQEGTTRDTVEASLIIGGQDVSLIDTAGIRKTKNVIEKKGISRTYDAINKSDLVLFVDQEDPIKESKKYSKILKNKEILFIKSKDDTKTTKTKGIISTSSKKEGGTSLLFTELLTFIKKHGDSFSSKYMFLINSRQRASLVSFVEEIKKGSVALTKTKDLVIASSYLRGAHDNLASLLHGGDKNSTINKIFKGFCVGK